MISRRHLLFVVTLLSLLGAACGQSAEALEATIDARVQSALTALPTVTPQPSATPAPSPTAPPTATPQPAPTPHPTATRAPAPTPLPSATPQPTATPAPLPTAQPTATPQPSPTPAPTATPQPTPTVVGDITKIYDQLRFSVVKVSTNSANGSGWAIEEGWIITNNHVISPHTSVSVRVPLADGGWVTKPGIVRGIDTRRDLAAIEVDHGAPVLPRSFLTVEDAGTRIIQIGYSTGTEGYPAVKTGIVTTVVRHLGNVLDLAPFEIEDGVNDRGVGVVIFDADADPGDSGGPVTDFEGTVIGITFGAIVFSSSGKRVIGQQKATSVRSIDRVWEDLKRGTNTTNVQ